MAMPIRTLAEKVVLRHSIGVTPETKLLAELLQLAQENVRGVDACRAGADYSNTKFISFSHAL